MVDKARDEADRVRSVADQVRSVADTERTVADHDRLEGDYSRAESTTAAVSDLAETISELGDTLVAMETERSQNVRELKSAFQRQRLTLVVLVAGVVLFVAAVFGLGRLVYGQASTNQRHVDCLAGALIGRNPPQCASIIADLRHQGVLPPIPTTTTTTVPS